ncbi:hypothetical protein ACIA8G_12210 [Lentzea sp. NPDC051213]|uniref:hypothetical protein n=1 Tax=Lentzea sp. NPDC051213 TaxID=3364126 RepID=UPI00378B489C
MLANEEVWLDRVAPDVVTALSEWTETAAVELEWRAWLSGRSGSAIARVRTKVRTGRREQILKLIPPELGKLESRNVSLAKQHSPSAFFDRHIIPTIVSEKLPGCSWYLHVQDVGGGDVSSWVPLANIMIDPALGDHCASIIKSVHLEWNAEQPYEHTEVPVNEYVHKSIADYLRPGCGLSTFTQETGLNLEKPDPYVDFSGRKERLPNPLALLRPTDEVIEIWSGLCHGDLHVHNLLVPTKPVIDANSYKLLDLGRFTYNGPLARDPMKLLGSIAAEWLPDLAPDTGLRRRLAELIVEPDTTSETPPTTGYRAVSQRIHEASELLALESGAGHDWPRQKLLALAIVALRLTSQHARFPSIADRRWFFEVAALATRAFHNLDHTNRNQPGAPIEMHRAAAVHELEFDEPAADRSAPPEAKIIQLRPRPHPDVVPELLLQLLHGIDNLSPTSSGERLADIGEGLRALATRLEHILEDAGDTLEVQLELRAVREKLIRMSNAVIAHKVLPDIRQAGEELRRSADQRWTRSQN